MQLEQLNRFCDEVDLPSLSVGNQAAVIAWFLRRCDSAKRSVRTTDIMEVLNHAGVEFPDHSVIRRNALQVDGVGQGPTTYQINVNKALMTAFDEQYSAVFSEDPIIAMASGEEELAKTLDNISSDAAACYRQACIDLRQEDKISWLGTASELRAVWLLILNEFAPHKEVERQPGFKGDNDGKATQKQRAKFALKKIRGLGDEAANIDLAYAEKFDELTAKAGRDFYTLTSDYAHTPPTQAEVEQAKEYLDLLLRDLTRTTA